MGQTALITGASSGIGEALAKQMGALGHPLVLVARRQERLEKMAAELNSAYGIQVNILPLDLEKPGAADELHNYCTELGITVDILVNNAGYGVYGPFIDNDADAEIGSAYLNMVTLTRLCQLFGRDMCKNGTGRIMNIGSTAAFQPNPYLAVYGATKSYVLTFSEAIHEELRKYGVSVTVLCPGPTVSEFHQRSGTDDMPFFKKVNMTTSEQVASAGYTAMMAGKALCVVGLANRIGSVLGQLAPRALTRRVLGKLLDR